MEVANFAEIEAEFIHRVHTTVWCNMATVDSRQRPRSRVIHPIWEGKIGWIGTHRTSYKHQHLLANPYVSLAYIADVMNPVYVDCTAEWVEDVAEKQRIWNLFLHAPPPLGYDPADTFGSFDHPDFGVLKLTPWRIALVSFPALSHELGQRIWRGQER